MLLRSICLFLSLTTTVYAVYGPGSPCTGETASIIDPSTGLVEIFFSGSDGRVYSSSQAKGAASFDIPVVIGTIRVAPCSPVSAVASGDDLSQLDIFVVGDNGPVNSASRTKGGDFTPWVQLAGGEAKAGTKISPVTTGGKVYVFWIGLDGIVYEIELRGGNSTAKSLGNDSIGPGTQVTVLPRYENPNTIDMFVVTSNQYVYHVNFEAADETPIWTSISYPGKKGAQAGAKVEAVVLDSGDCHLFVSALDGLVYTSVRTHSPATPFSAWTVTGDISVPISAPVYGVKTAASTIELFVTGLDSLVYMSTWNAGFSAWEAVGGVSTVSGAPITGLSTSDTQFLLFVTGLNKNISTTEWNVGQGRDCAWWGVGEEKISCSQKAGDEGEGVGAQSLGSGSSDIGGGKSGMYIGIGVVVGLLIGILVVGGPGFWFYKRKMKLVKEREDKAREPDFAPAELACGLPSACELPDTDSGKSLKS